MEKLKFQPKMSIIPWQNELTKEMNLLYDNLEAYRKNPDSRYIQRKLKALLRRESAFAAFKRNYIRDNSKEFPQLQSYIE